MELVRVKSLYFLLGATTLGFLSPAYAQGFFRGPLNAISPGLGDQVDKENDKLKKGLPGYGAIDKGVSEAGRAAGTAVQTVGGNVIQTTVKAANDVVVTVRQAATDMVATYEKGWRDTTVQARQSFEDTVDAGRAIGRYASRQSQDYVKSISNAANRARQGKVIDAMWGLAIEPTQATERNFGKAAQESAVINTAAQAAATAYGGPAGAAAYSAWATYNATGDANLAMRAGVLSAATSAAGGSVANMPSGTAAELVKKAAVAGAVGGIAVAAAGGDEKAITDGFLRSGGTVLVQGASTRLRAYSPKSADAVQAIQCISARDVDCISNTTYARDLKGKMLYDSHGRPRVDLKQVDLQQRIGQWSVADPNSTLGKQRATMIQISKLLGTQAIPIGENRFIITWTLGSSSSLPYNSPAVVLTYVGQKRPFFLNTTYKKIAPK